MNVGVTKIKKMDINTGVDEIIDGRTNGQMEASATKTSFKEARF